MLKSKTLFILFLSLFFIPANTSHSESTIKRSLVRVTTPGGEVLSELERSGLDIVKMKIDEYVEIITTEDELIDLASRGLTYQVIHEDLSAFYQSRLDTSQGRGSMGGYHTFEEVVAVLDLLAATHPDIVSEKISLGKSIEGRDIWAVKISDNPGQDEDEPEVFYNSLIHAREPMSLETLLFFMEYLVSNYGVKREVTFLVDNREMWFMPVINPDGYVYNNVSSPFGGGLWRKNRRDNGDGTFGVDLNRNFSFRWGFNDAGSSPIPGSTTYRGPAPFSEPESRVFRDFVQSHNFILSMDCHTFGNLILYPFSYINEHTPDSTLYFNLTRDMTRFNGYRYGRPGDLNVSGGEPNGVTFDWMYGEQTAKPKIYGMAPEIGTYEDGFWPPTERIVPLAMENVFPNMFVAYVAGNYVDVVSFQLTEIEGNEDGVLTTGELAELRVTLRNKGLTLDVKNVEGILKPNELRVRIISNEASFGDLASGQETEEQSESFLLTTIGKRIDSRMEANLTLELTGDDGYFSKSEFSIQLDGPLLGDINFDSRVDVNDLIGIINSILRLSILNNAQIAAVDLNEDGVITVDDLIAVINLILQGG